MYRNQLFEPFGYVIAAVSALFSFILFYNDTGTLWGSLFAALMAAALFWLTYVVIRLIFLAFK